MPRLESTDVGDKYKLLHSGAPPWPVKAMPQVSPVEHSSQWFDEEDFATLKFSRHLFDYNGHIVCAYKMPADSRVILFVALKDVKPYYVNEVHEVDVEVADIPGAIELKNNLSRYNFWTQTSVAFSADADRQALKGLATKIFWDYLASDGNVAITDSHRTKSASEFWRKTVARAWFMSVVSGSGSTHSLKIVHSNSHEFADRTHMQYDLRHCWTESAEGKNMRVLVTNSLR